MITISKYLISKGIDTSNRSQSIEIEKVEKYIEEFSKMVREEQIIYSSVGAAHHTAINVRNVPETCYKKMCQVNYHAYKNRANIYGDKPDLKEMGVWQLSKDYKKSKKSPAKK